MFALPAGRGGPGEHARDRPVIGVRDRTRRARPPREEQQPALVAPDRELERDHETPVGGPGGARRLEIAVGRHRRYLRPGERLQVEQPDVEHLRVLAGFGVPEDKPSPVGARQADVGLSPAVGRRGCDRRDRAGGSPGAGRMAPPTRTSSARRTSPGRRGRPSSLRGRRPAALPRSRPGRPRATVRRRSGREVGCHRGPSAGLAPYARRAAPAGSSGSTPRGTPRPRGRRPRPPRRCRAPDGRPPSPTGFRAAPAPASSRTGTGRTPSRWSSHRAASGCDPSGPASP